MRLQTIITQPPMAGTEAMCFRILSDGTLSFDTYFGVFPASLWKARTCACDFSLHLRVNGAGAVRLVADGQNIAERNFSGGELIVPFDPGDAEMVWLTLAGGMDLEYAYFEGVVDAPRDVILALNICTYQREEYILRNTALIKKEIWDNEKSPLCGRLEIFVSDNAGTLSEIPGVSIYKNINAGGSGGFARGLIEIMNEGRATHAAFMDDDITILPEALERLYALLVSVRPEYANRPIGGAMLRLDAPCRQHESLAIWRGLLSDSLMTGLDMGRFGDVCASARDTKADYSAWWFSCVSMEMIKKKGLPLPIFVRMDDIEYGLRLGERPMAMPGICVWHEAFECKHSAKTEYYHARNALIVDALRTPDMPAVKLVRNLVMGQVLRFRYIHAEMAIKGAEDYLKGPEYLIKTDPDVNNSALQNVEIVPLERLPGAKSASSGLPDTRLFRLICALTLNGAVLPAKKNAVVYAHKNSVRAHLGKKGAVNVIEGTGTGFYAKRDTRRALGILWRLFRLEETLKRENAHVSMRWREAEGKMTSEGFWCDYLKLGQKARK